MKTLYLLRHAKSSWNRPELRDFERTLAERGLLDIEKMAERFSQGERRVQCIISSPAVRAKTTAMQFARDIGFEEEEVAANPELYFAGTAMFLKAARLIDDVYDSAMLVGHNPAITEFVNQMCHADIENIPTCGLVELRLPVERWSEATLGAAELIDFDFPKRKHEGTSE